MELCLAHLALEAQKEPVVDVGQVIDAIVVDDQGGCQAGQLQQPGKAGVGAGEPGDLQPEHRTHLARAHPRDQLPEPVPVTGGAPGQAQVGVDHLDRRARPAQPGRLPGQVVLAQRGLGVLADLHQGRLADIHDRGPFQVCRGYLLLSADHRPSPAQACPCRKARIRPCRPAPRSSPPARTPPPDPAAARRRQRARPSPVPGGTAAPG